MSLTLTIYESIIFKLFLLEINHITLKLLLPSAIYENKVSKELTWQLHLKSFTYVNSSDHEAEKYFVTYLLEYTDAHFTYEHKNRIPPGKAFNHGVFIISILHTSHGSSRGRKRSPFTAWAIRIWGVPAKRKSPSLVTRQLDGFYRGRNPLDDLYPPYDRLRVAWGGEGGLAPNVLSEVMEMTSQWDMYRGNTLNAPPCIGNAEKC